MERIHCKKCHKLCKFIAEPAGECDPATGTKFFVLKVKCPGFHLFKGHTNLYFGEKVVAGGIRFTKERLHELYKNNRMRGSL